ncbi:MAG TPA: transglycosylase SLT domain-containing protein [Sphingomonadaceae bacterium]|nr:transglycosylase SLT domain-containing protein [Sphingomonadaceae bacterium]
MRCISRQATASFFGALALVTASPAAADSAEYFREHALKSEVPTLLGQDDKAYYRQFFAAIRREEWNKVQDLLKQRSDGPLHSVAIAEYYLAANSPRVEAAQIEAWLLGGLNLPQAEQLITLGLKRGLAVNPTLPYQNQFYSQPSSSKRVRPATVVDGTLPQSIRDAIIERITNDDPDGARQLLDGIDASLSPQARAEWRQRVAWSYYIENQDQAALALAQTVAEGSGPWVAEGEWVKGLAAWRLGDCLTSLNGFERTAGFSANSELTAAALYWASRAAVRCRMPDKADDYLRNAARLDETLYGMLAAEQLGMALPERFTSSDFGEEDWRRLRDEENVRIAVQLAEIGEDDLSSEVLLYQARIGDPGDYDALSRLARELGLPATQLYMAHNAPRGGRSDPASRYPAPRWTPSTGWRIDPALAYAHTLQESNFRTSVTSPADAKGLMQITPITVREHAPRLNMNASYVDLTDPRVNLAFGQENLEMLRDTPATEGKLPKIMAAYNAGLTPVTRWNYEIRDLDDPLLYMESIPYWETRGYVAIVLKNYWMYERQAHSASASRKALASGQWPRFPGDEAPTNGRVFLRAANAK